MNRVDGQMSANSHRNRNESSTKPKGHHSAEGSPGLSRTTGKLQGTDEKRAGERVDRPTEGRAATALAFAQGITTLPLTFGEILAFIGIWLAIGMLLGQNKPAGMPLFRYLPRRLTVYLCCYVFVITMSYSNIRHDPVSAHET